MSGVTTIGFKEFGNKVKALAPTTKTKASAIVDDAAKLWARLAKVSAPKDFGTIAKGIGSQKVGEMTAEVYSNAKHSRWMEFGTKRRKSVPSELSSYEASLDYEKTGDYYDFLNAILDWVKRKGLSDVVNSYTGKKVGGKMAKENQVVIAEAIAFSIIRHGVKPHPFFFQHREEVFKYMNDMMSKYLNKEQ